MTDSGFMQHLAPTKEKAPFNQISISIARPDDIRSWSQGEVIKPETINYRTFKPENGGLFCAKIFGPVKDYECLCGKYRRMKHRGVTCEKCGVEVTLSKVRRERMGHIVLQSPVAHIWFLKALPSRIGLMVDMTLRAIESILYFEKYVVTEPGTIKDLHRGTLLSENEYEEAKDQYGDAFKASIGAEALQSMLREIDLKKEQAELIEAMKKTESQTKLSKYIKRLKVIKMFDRSQTRPEWMIMDVLPVISPDLRPLVPMEGGRFATSDLNDLYRRVISRNNRLKRLEELRAPGIIVRNEKRMLQESVDALFDNGRRGRVISGSNRRPLKSLSDMLKGKQGRFRQNLLGKRVDYSGRSVIVVGPNLKLHQCGIPKRMALELFRPFIYSELERHHASPTIKAAKKMVERERREVWDILERVIREHPVLLNRAPTLHRLGIQAFEPLLVEGKAIQLHPLVCAAFNADFDGDQMAVHVPLSLEARLEARVLMMSSNNILSPANGNPVIGASQDIVLGLYYLSLIDEHKQNGKDKPILLDIGEIMHALHCGACSLHTPIRSRFVTVDAKGKPQAQSVETTPGRMIIADVLPRHPRIDFSLVNKVLDKQEISNIIDTVYRHCGQKETVLLADRLMGLGFREACRSGISFGKDDLIIPRDKGRLIEAAQKTAKEYEQQYLDGLITQGEKYNKVVDVWTRCTEKVAEHMMREMSPQQDDLPSAIETNSVYMMAHSGARGSPTQIKQLAGMRGLMAKPSGEIIETPIISNFKEGLTVLEYFNSTHGARKGLADTALKTANSGYLTRRLVDVAQDCIVCEEDCGTEEGLMLEAATDGDQEIESLADRILGRCAAEDIKDPEGGKVVVKRNALIDESVLKRIEDLSLPRIKVRSVLLCQSKRGCCVRCYGRDLARGSLVNIGEAVGVIAAQSIGEPGTQLTMRTFHIGGAAQRGSEESGIHARINGTVEVQDSRLVVDSKGRQVVMSRHARLVLKVDGKERIKHRIPYGARLLVKDGSKVEQGTLVAEWEPYTQPVITEYDGYVHYHDIVDGVSIREETDDITGIANKVIIDSKAGTKASSLKPSIVISATKDGKKDEDKHTYGLMVGTVLSVEEGTHVKAGDILARLAREPTKTRDITGGLPRVAEIFEARKPKNEASMADRDGHVKIEEQKSKRKIKIVDDSGNESPAILIAKDKYLEVQDGAPVEKGDLLTDGTPSLNDTLAIQGIEKMANELITEVQAIYRAQGVKINDKHIEVIVRQMMQKVEVNEVGDSKFMIEERPDRDHFKLICNKLRSEGKREPKGHPVLLGITKAALHTKSFISAASFQETTRVLTEAAVSGKIDKLEGLKENVIVGRLVPAGTGRYVQGIMAQARALDIEHTERRNKSDVAALEAQGTQGAPETPETPEASEVPGEVQEAQAEKKDDSIEKVEE